MSSCPSSSARQPLTPFCQPCVIIEATHKFWFIGVQVMGAHALLIQLIVGYTLAGALVFTAIITCLSLVGWIKFADQAQQNKLFYVLIVELVVIGVGFFAGMLNFDPQQVESKIREVEQYNTLSTGLKKFQFATEILHEFLDNQLTTKTAMVSSVTEYNEAIIDLRTNEASSLQLLQIHPDENKELQFKEIMELVKRIDKSVHGLNEELEKVAIKETQEEISPERATMTAAELKPLIAELKTKVQDLLEFGDSD